MAQVEEVKVPDIGDFDAVDVIEILVSAGDRVEVDDPLITLESDKASMEVPSPRAGTIREVKVASGDQVAEGDVIVLLEADEETAAEETPDEETAAEEETSEDTTPDEEATREAPSAAASSATAPESPEPEPSSTSPAEPVGRLDEDVDEEGFARAHASPSVRRFARELGVDLSRVSGSGRKGRILREDVQAYVRERLEGAESGAGARSDAGLLDLPEAPEVDFSQYGPVETEELTKIQRLTGRNLHRSWVTIPHVTQLDEADVTELEEFRRSMKPEAQERGVSLTPLPFLIKACAAALREHLRFNASLAPDGERLVLKGYVHMGIAVDTPRGLVVPVVRDVDQKGLFELAEEVADLATRARERKLKAEDLEGGCFTISSLGHLGGTAFTPIINPPEVAILGVSRMDTRPVWRDGEFVPRKILPFSLSYDHRVIDGVAGVRFTRTVAGHLEDLRRLLL